jgi:nucleoid DNA-binding protein
MAKAPTKTAVLNSIAEKSGVNKKDVALVLDALAASIGETISDGKTPYTIPGLCKVVPQIKAAAPAKFQIPNPFKPAHTITHEDGTVEEVEQELMDVAAKPERKVVKVRPLKGLKDMVSGSAPAAEAPAAAEAEAPASDPPAADPPSWG